VDNKKKNPPKLKGIWTISQTRIS